MNPFYELNKTLQWLIALFMFSILLVIFYYFMVMVVDYPLFYLSVFIFTPILQFLMTPFLRLIGVYEYLSPMLLVYNANAKKYDLHNGTSFDYLMVMMKYKRGIEMRQKILGFYIEGLLKLIGKIEDKSLPGEVVVKGSSYFFSDRTAERVGFKLTKANAAIKFNIILNYLDLLWMYSMAHGKLVFPSLKNIKTAEITGHDLVASKQKLEELDQFLKRKQIEKAMEVNG